MVKCSIEQEYFTIINKYAPNFGAPRFVKQLLLHLKKTDTHTLKEGDFNMAPSAFDRSSRKITHKENLSINLTADKLELIEIYRTLHPKTIEYTKLPSAYGRYSDTLKNIKIIWNILSDYSGIKVQTHSMINFQNHKNTWKQYNLLLNDFRVNNEIEAENFQNYLKSMKRVTQCTKISGIWKKQC